jgi:hypothetical protein
MKTLFHVACALLAAWPLTSPAATLQKKVLIMGVDGMRPAALAGANTPTLDALEAAGCSSYRAVTHPVTHSAACWASMFTGVWGDKHGINDPGNSITGNRLDLYPSFFKRLEAANSNLNTVAFARWCPLLDILPDADVKQCFGSDDAITAETCRRLTNSNPDVLYMILLDVDSAGHNPGWFSATYTNEIQKADARIGRIMGALTNRATFTNEDWLVVVLSDHGKHDDPDVELSRITYHLFWGPSAARGAIWPAPSIVDVCATLLTHLGLPIDPGWNLDGRIEGLPLAPARYGSNLLFNGDAECNSGTNNYTTNRGVAWWWDVSGTSLGCYGANTSFPTLDSSGPTNRGRNFFLGGTVSGFISQRIHLSDLAADIDDPGVDYLVSGWFGGKGTEGDSAALVVRFLDAAGLGLATNRIGDVSAAERGNLTGLIERSTNGVLPTGTRFAEFVLTNRMVAAPNDASADDLSFVLSPRSDPPFLVQAPRRIPDGWELTAEPTRTSRFYRLWRSTDFSAWTDLGEEHPGTGGALLLRDTNAPATQAFYRISSRRP